MDNHRKQLKKEYPTFEKFKEAFNVPQELLDQVVSEAEGQKVKPRDDEELQRTMPLLALQLKALIARDLWDMSEYYSVINEDSEIVKKALELFDYFTI